MRLLDRRRIVVWYDAEVVFEQMVRQLELANCIFVLVSESSLQARRTAEEAHRKLDEVDAPAARRNLLIYVPAARGDTPEEQQQDPFEAFTRCGDSFGDREGEQLRSLAELALPNRAGEIDRLFQHGRPSLALLDGLVAGARFPLLRQALGTEGPIDALAAAFSQSDAGEQLAAVPGALGELQQLAEAELGLPQQVGESWAAFCERLASFVLVSELALDLPSEIPASLDGVPKADGAKGQRVLDLTKRWRETEAGRDSYMEAARRVEKDLRLPSKMGAEVELGSRDTFLCQDEARLKAVIESAVAGDIRRARELCGAGESTVWRREPERAILWHVIQRCLSFLELVEGLAKRTALKSVRGSIEAYTAADGLWQVDRAQRLFEQAGAQGTQGDEVEPLIQVCRRRYREVVGPTQSAFQSAVKAEGWPPEEVKRQMQIFDNYVAPELAAKRKTAYFLVDSLRYEMGRDLASALDDLGLTMLDVAVSVLPPTTPFGMAALMPGADGSFEVSEHRGELVPIVAGSELAGVDERRKLLSARYGDRLFETTLEDMLTSTPKQLAKRIGVADFVVVRTQDIDALGEGWSLFHARKLMSDVIGDLKRAAQRLAALQFETIVFAADHGHVLMPEILPGDVVSVLPGEWLMRKRRSLLGRHTARAPGVLTFRAEDVGISGSVEELAVAADFKTFIDGPGYFHEGLSLQECVIPVLVARVRPMQTTTGGEQVSISYRSERFTSSIVGLKLFLTAMFTPSLAVRLEAFDGAAQTARSVGQAGDCDARDPATGEIMLRAGIDTPVPLLINPEFTGPSIEVRASDPRTGAILQRLTLRNGRLD
jgi:PglZ domain